MRRMNEHELHMRRAIELAANVPEFPFGALIVDRASGRVVSEVWNKCSINPTFHGEIDAIDQLVLTNPGIETNQLVLYTTAEPCPMCQGAILWTGIESVVYGTFFRSLQKMGWRQIDIFAEEVVRRSPTWRCTITGGVLEQEYDALFELAISRGKYSK
jgi:tRNA(adenine34) deaminase